MEQEECILSDQVRINGRTTAAALSAAGQLRWDEHRLDVEKEVLGFSVDGLKVKIRAVVEAGAGICCCGGKSSLIRRTFVLELLSRDSLRIWTQKLQEYLDSLGMFLSSSRFFCGDWSKITIIISVTSGVIWMVEIPILPGFTDFFGLFIVPVLCVWIQAGLSGCLYLWILTEGRKLRRRFLKMMWSPYLMMPAWSMLYKVGTRLSLSLSELLR